MEGKFVRKISLVLLLSNAMLRLLLSSGNLISPINRTIFTTGLLTLFGFFYVLFDLYHSEILSAFIFAFSAGTELLILPIVQNVFLFLSILSLLALILSVYIEKNKENIKPLLRSKKKLLTIVLIPLISISFLPVNQVKASTIVDHVNFESNQNHFTVSVYIYKYEDTVEGKDFYGFWILLHTEDVAYFDWISYLELYFPGATFDDWQPKAGMTTGGSISLSPSGPSISISLPLSDVRVDGCFSDKLTWFVNPLGSNPQDLEFAARAWVNSGHELQWRIRIKAYSYWYIAGIPVYFWDDTAYYSTIPDPPSVPHRRRSGGGSPWVRFCVC